MEVIKNESFHGSNEYESKSFITNKELVSLLNASLYKEELIKLFGYDEEKIEILQIGHSRNLLDSLKFIDSQCVKIDLISKMRDVQLRKMMESEKALFEVTNVKDSFILTTNGSDILDIETRYDAKNNILDYYNFAKFANYCRDNGYDDLIDIVKEDLKLKNLQNDESRKLRLLYLYDDKKFYVRALVSDENYKDFGINFSVFVALMAISKYSESTGTNIYISNYQVNDSTIFLSFSFKEKKAVGNDMSLAFNLILENDEIKRNAVSFNGLFKLRYSVGNKSSEITIRPHGFKSSSYAIPVDLLNYRHSGSVKSVFDKIQSLPKLIEHFISQVSYDVEKITSIKNPDDVRKFIGEKVKRSKKAEFKQYKHAVFVKLMSVSVDSVFTLFDLLRSVEDLFEHDDVVSVNFWRTKLYEALIEKK